MGKFGQYFKDYKGLFATNILIGGLAGAIGVYYYISNQIPKPDLVIHKPHFSVEVYINDIEAARLYGMDKLHSLIDEPMTDVDFFLKIRKEESKTKNPETLKAVLDLEARLYRLKAEYLGRETAIIRDYNEFLEDRNKFLRRYLEELRKLEELK